MQDMFEQAKWEQSSRYFSLTSVRTEYSQMASGRSLIHQRRDPLEGLWAFSPADTASLSTETQGALESTAQHSTAQHACIA
jgi:hypothetical protein